MEQEISRLLDVLPASGRMYCKIVSNPSQSSLIQIRPPLPGQGLRPISINLDLWQQLPQGQRDLLLLRSASWLVNYKWVSPNLFTGLAAIGAIATMVEFSQGDGLGTLVAGGITAAAGAQLWRSHRSPQRDLAADEAAVRIAQRRGYSESEAAKHLINAIQAAAQIEGRGGPSVVELVRCQHLKAIAAHTTTYQAQV